MKKNLLITVTTISILWLGLRYYTYLDSKYMFNNQTVFEIYSEINENEIDDFFALEPGTFDKNKHKIICKLPVEVPSFSKKMNVIVQFGTEKINCKEEFDPNKHTKYNLSELNDNEAILMIVDNRNMIEVVDFDLPIAGNVYGTVLIKLEYTRGKINHLVISEDGIHEYCK